MFPPRGGIFYEETMRPDVSSLEADAKTATPARLHDIVALLAQEVRRLEAVIEARGNREQAQR